MRNDICIIIPVYNRVELTLKCVMSLQNQTVTGFSIIVIDDGSTDDSLYLIRKQFPLVKVMHGNGNLWWAGATNAGINYAMTAGYNYIMCLNNDVEVANDFIEQILLAAEKKPDALIGAAGYNIKTGKLNYIGSTFNWKKGIIVDLLEKYPERKEQNLIMLTNFIGRGLLIPVKVFEKIGLFNNYDFPQGLADLDFTLMAHRAGFEIYCSTKSKVFAHSDLHTSKEYFEKYNLKNFYLYLTDIKGAGNIKFRWKFGMRNAPDGYKFYYSIVSISRCILGYIRRWSGDKKINRI